MEAKKLKQVEVIRKGLRNRQRNDGSESSGNWGHVGRPGKKGGSAKGGGSAFRLTKTVSGKYTSQARIRDDTKKAYRAAVNSGNEKMAERIKKRMEKINMTTKSADVSKVGKKGYSVVKRIDKDASRNILADKKRGKTARESTVTKAAGTKEAIQFAFPNRTIRGGSGAHGGKTAEVKSKK